MDESFRQKWRCPSCARVLDPHQQGDPSWRLLDGRWQHRCPGVDPQVGYIDAEPVGRVIDPDDPTPPKVLGFYEIHLDEKDLVFQQLRRDVSRALEVGVHKPRWPRSKPTGLTLMNQADNREAED